MNGIVGRIVSALKAKNMYNNTLIVFSSDKWVMSSSPTSWSSFFENLTPSLPPPHPCEAAAPFTIRHRAATMTTALAVCWAGR